MKTKKITKTFAMLILSILSISFICAFSVSYPYMENKKMNMVPNEIKEIEFVLQNGGGATTPLNIKIKVIEGSEIIEFLEEKDIFLVNPGDKVPIKFKIKVPENAKSGQEYNIKISFSEVSINKDILSFGTEIEQNFKVVVEEPKKENKQNWLKISAIILSSLIIIILCILIIIKIKKKSK
jgi:uncharacterized membrane protein